MKISLMLVAVAASFAAVAANLEMHRNDEWRSVPVDRVRLEGPLGRRIALTATNNLMKIDLEKNFFGPFRQKTADGGFIGLGKLLDGAAYLAKYTGFQNAMRVIFSWNDSKDTATTVTPMVTRDFGEKYRALSEHCRQQIYTAFRAVPSLFGLSTASGFSTEEYEEAFKLYNRTRIQPMQRTIIDAYAKVLGPGRVTIVPFSLSGSGEDTIK